MPGGEGPSPGLPVTWVIARGGITPHPNGCDNAVMAEIDDAVRAPGWLRNFGLSAWLLLGVGLLFAGVIWLLGQAATIVGPILLALVVATVASPLVARMHGRGLGRAWGALIVLLALVAVAVVLLFLVLHGIVGQGDELGKLASKAADKGKSWPDSAGADPGDAASAEEQVKSAVPAVISGLAGRSSPASAASSRSRWGCRSRSSGCSSCSRDGPKLRGVVERNLRPAAPRRRTSSSARSSSRSGATFSASRSSRPSTPTVVGIAALVLGVPLAGTIAVVTFATAYIPFIGAFVSGAFAVDHRARRTRARRRR